MQIFKIFKHDVRNWPNDFEDENNDETGTKIRVIAEDELIK
jgi:hypothetical protein